MFLTKYETQIYTILRVAAGFLFLWHGSQKLFGYPSAIAGIPVHIVIIGGSVEFFGGLFVMVGLFTRWAAFIASGEMAFAYWSSHGTTAILPFVNHGELAMLYCFLFLFIAAKGSGNFSIDQILKKTKQNSEEVQNQS
jgi:putative oxidoreductase